MPEDTLHTWRREQLVAEVRRLQLEQLCDQNSVRSLRSQVEALHPALVTHKERIVGLEAALQFFVDCYEYDTDPDGDMSKWNFEQRHGTSPLVIGSTGLLAFARASLAGKGHDEAMVAVRAAEELEP